MPIDSARCRRTAASLFDRLMSALSIAIQDSMPDTRAADPSLCAQHASGMARLVTGRRGWLFGDQRELADPTLPEPVGPQPMGGEQLVKCSLPHLRGDARRLCLVRLGQGLGRRPVGPGALG